MSILVFRVEQEDGSGPYWGKTLSKESWFSQSICNHNSNSRPGPYQCNKLREMNPNELKKYSFAFSTLKQLERWFTKTDRALLHENGYHISIYKVPKSFYIKTNNQCIFNKEHSILVKQINIKEYYQIKKDKNEF